MAEWVLMHDLRAPEFGTPRPALYREALDMCAWADARGCPRVVLSEHHGSDDGYLPSPFVFGAAVAARTAHTRIMVSALVLTLRDPVSAAEDALVLDVVSDGRLELTLAAGYVPSECAMFGVPFDDRAAVFTAKTEAFVAALTGEPFTYEGRTIRVTPPPVQRPRPFVVLGGSAPKRAARLGDAYLPPLPDESLATAYVAECRRLGKGDGLLLWPAGPMWVFVTEDPERTWAQLGPHALHETNAYGAWAAEVPGANPWAPRADVAAVRADGLYAVVTPEQCVALARHLDPRAALKLKPLVSGLDPDIGWRSLELFVNAVLPALGPAPG
ncbi:MAG TPA: LLM class flavin-dependent oxidoreductase [Acidimicrobiales bacterium]|nr:LLM class flavin-dependent oxidoreductase [Acidimicrobiales bacterium]